MASRSEIFPSAPGLASRLAIELVSPSDTSLAVVTTSDWTTATETAALAVCAPPDPVFPRSFTAICTVAVPAKLFVGVNASVPAAAALMSKPASRR